MSEKLAVFKHWPTVLLGVVVAVVLLMAVFSFQLNQTEIAVVTTFGRPEAVTEPGLYFRWPFPFQRVYTFDRRIRCFGGSSGALEETGTRDQHNIVVSIFVNYRIADATKFFVSLENMNKAEDRLNSLMRGAKNAAFGQYDFRQVINTDGRAMKLDEIREKIRKSLDEATKNYGIEVVSIGINGVNVPQSVTEKVFDRMIAERKQLADKYLAEGAGEAKKIRIQTDSARTLKLADAEARALEIRAKGDAEAAKYYAVFKTDPELAAFLRKLESLKLLMRGRTTLLIDTNTAPFDLLKSGLKPMPNGDKPTVRK